MSIEEIELKKGEEKTTIDKVTKLGLKFEQITFTEVKNKLLINIETTDDLLRFIDAEL